MKSRKDNNQVTGCRLLGQQEGVGQPKQGGTAFDYPTAGFGQVLHSPRKNCSLPRENVAPPLRTTKLPSRSSSGLVLRSLGRLVVPPDASAAQGGSGRSEWADKAWQRVPIRQPKLLLGKLPRFTAPPSAASPAPAAAAAAFPTFPGFFRPSPW